MHRIVVIGLFSSLNLWDMPAQEGYSFDEHIDILLSSADDRWVTPELKPKVIQRLKMLQSDPSQTEDAQKRILGCLAEMGDNEAIVNFLKSDIKPTDKLNNFYNIYIQHATPAQLIPHYIDRMIKGDPVSRNLVPSEMDQATVAAYYTIYSSSLFPQKTREWADNCFHFYRGGDLGHGRNCKGQQLLFSWWEHNKDAIIAGRYGDATWLPVMEDEATLRKEMLEGKTNSNERNLISPDKPLIAQVAPDNSWQWPIGLSVLIATILGGGFWLYRLRTKTR